MNGGAGSGDRGQIHLLAAARRWEQMLDTVDAQLAERPDDAHLWMDRAAALGMLERHQESLDAAERAAGLAPGADRPHRLRAEAYRRLRKPREAVAAAREAVALAPTSDAAQLTLVDALLSMRGRSSSMDAIQVARVVVERSPQSAAGWIALGHAQLGLNDRAATDSLKRALALQPGSLAATNGLGLAYKNLGKRSEAAALFERAARLDPNETAPTNNLERLARPAGFAGAGFLAWMVAGVPNRAVAVVLLVAVAAIAITVKRRRTASAMALLSPDARRFVEAKRAEQLAVLRSPRRWRTLLADRALLRRVGVTAVFALIIVAAFFGRRVSLENDEPTRNVPDINLPSSIDLDLFQPTPTAPPVVVVTVGDILGARALPSQTEQGRP